MYKGVIPKDKRLNVRLFVTRNCRKLKGIAVRNVLHEPPEIIWEKST